jgi:hypothetical protein
VTSTLLVNKRAHKPSTGKRTFGSLRAVLVNALTLSTITLLPSKMLIGTSNLFASTSEHVMVAQALRPGTAESRVVLLTHSI